MPISFCNSLSLSLSLSSSLTAPIMVLILVLGVFWHAGSKDDQLYCVIAVLPDMSVSSVIRSSLSPPFSLPACSSNAPSMVSFQRLGVFCLFIRWLVQSQCTQFLLTLPTPHWRGRHPISSDGSRFHLRQCDLCQPSPPPPSLSQFTCTYNNNLYMTLYVTQYTCRSYCSSLLPVNI